MTMDTNWKTTHKSNTIPVDSYKMTKIENQIVWQLSKRMNDINKQLNELHNELVLCNSLMNEFDIIRREHVQHITEHNFT